MKVLVVMGSPRKGNTYRAAERIRELMEAHGPVEFEYLWLRDANLLPCRGCFVCVEKGEETCPNRDDAPAIVRRMREADGVILASPVYGMNVSGLFKVFVDRFSYIIHRPRFFDKKALLLTTTGAFGTKETEDYLAIVAQVWGFEIAGRAGLITPPGTAPRVPAGGERAEPRNGGRIVLPGAPVRPAEEPGAEGRRHLPRTARARSTSSRRRLRSITGTGRSRAGSSPVPGTTSTCRSTPSTPRSAGSWNAW